jgi:hypothetical protein
MQNTNTNTNTNNPKGKPMTLFIQSQMATIGNNNIQLTQQSNITTEKSKKKSKKNTKNKKSKKKVSYKKLLRSMTQSTRTDEQKKNDYKNRLSQSLGGGRFNKIDNI